MYLVAVDAPSGARRWVSFVVRAPLGQRAALVLVSASATSCAYNDWGGPSLYDGAHRVSFERPWCQGFLDRPDEPVGRHAVVGHEPDPDCTGYRDYVQRHGLSIRAAEAGWFGWERRFVRWAESNGYRIDLAQSTDLIGNDEGSGDEVLAGYSAMISVGHDEYWSAAMRNTVESFTADGGNVAWFSANNSFWQVRFEESSAGRSAAEMISYKYEAPWTDPVIGTHEESTVTAMWSDPLIGRPENTMTGVSFSRGGYVRFGNGVPRGSGGYTVQRPGHWIFAGTDLRVGDLFGTEAVVVGYEADGCELAWIDGQLVPTGADGTPEEFEILATSPARLWSSTPENGSDLPPYQEHPLDTPADLEYVALRLYGDMSTASTDRLAHGHAVLGMFQRPDEGMVMTTGCTDWAHGLDPIPDRDVVAITRNILDRFGA